MRLTTQQRLLELYKLYQQWWIEALLQRKVQWIKILTIKIASKEQLAVIWYRQYIFISLQEIFELFRIEMDHMKMNINQSVNLFRVDKYLCKFCNCLKISVIWKPFKTDNNSSLILYLNVLKSIKDLHMCRYTKTGSVTIRRKSYYALICQLSIHIFVWVSFSGLLGQF